MYTFVTQNFVGACGKSQDLVQNFAKVGEALIIQMVKSPLYPYWWVGCDLDRCIRGKVGFRYS